METLRNDESATWTETLPDGATKEITMTRMEIIRELVDEVQDSSSSGSSDSASAWWSNAVISSSSTVP